MKEYANVLIVDDSSTSRMIIQRCMEMTGLKIAEYSFAENGLEAIGKLKANSQIDLVITDINMPKMDGQTFSRLLRGEMSMNSLPVIVVTSIASETTESDLMALGINAVIRKPLSPAKLLAALGGME